MELQKKEVNIHGCEGAHTCKCQQKAYGLCGGCGSHNQGMDSMELTEAEREFVEQLESHCYLPVVQFLVQDTTDPVFKIVAFSPVYMAEEGEAMEEIQAMGKMLVALQKKKVLTLDYHLPLQGYGYEEYLQSDVFLAFAKKVAEEVQEEYAGVFATIQKGSMALTQSYLDAMG